MNSLFEKITYDNIIGRLEALEEHATPQWGKMSATQMVTHCQEPLKLGLEKATIKHPNILKRYFFLLFKKSLYDDTLWKKNLPTAKEYRVVHEGDFSVEKNTLRSLIGEFHENKSREQWPIHPLFGKFTPEQWGKMQYKHLDHHFRQFGV